MHFILKSFKKSLPQALPTFPSNAVQDTSRLVFLRNGYAATIAVTMKGGISCDGSGVTLPGRSFVVRTLRLSTEEGPQGIFLLRSFHKDRGTSTTAIPYGLSTAVPASRNSPPL